jgi:hypothetical protein
LFSSLLVAACLVTLWGVWGQRSELAGLRAEQQQLIAQLAAKSGGSASAVAAETSGAGSGTASPTLAVTPELLRLRSEVTRLAERRRELASVRGENERLRAELASRSTNGVAGYRFPPDYVRQSEARMVGYNTPEDTLQSLLWAVRNHNLTNALRAFVPEMANELRIEFGKSGQSMEDFFSKAVGFFGMRIAERSTVVNDGSLLVWVELVPGMPGPTLHLAQTNGQWKIASRP